MFQDPAVFQKVVYVRAKCKVNNKKDSKFMKHHHKKRKFV